MGDIKLLEQQLNECRNENDVDKMINSCGQILCTDGMISCERFWDDAKKNLLKAVILYLVETKNGYITFEMVLDTLRLFPVVKEENSVNPLNNLFTRYYKENPDSVACKYYEKFKDNEKRVRYTVAVCLISVMEEYFR